MSVPVVHEDPALTRKFRGLLEFCCFCWKPTTSWHEPKDVAVCESCAETHEPEDVPSKDAWCAAVAARSVQAA